MTSNAKHEANPEAATGAHPADQRQRGPRGRDHQDCDAPGETGGVSWSERLFTGNHHEQFPYNANAGELIRRGA